MSETKENQEPVAVGSDSNDGLGDTITVDLAHYAKIKNERDQYHDVLQDIREQIADCLERDAKAFMGMTMEQAEAWDIARHNQTHGWVLDRIKDVLA